MELRNIFHTREFWNVWNDEWIYDVKMNLKIFTVESRDGQPQRLTVFLLFFHAVCCSYACMLFPWACGKNLQNLIGRNKHLELIQLCISVSMP